MTNRRKLSFAILHAFPHSNAAQRFPHIRAEKRVNTIMYSKRTNNVSSTRSHKICTEETAEKARITILTSLVFVRMCVQFAKHIALGPVEPRLARVCTPPFSIGHANGQGRERVELSLGFM